MDHIFKLIFFLCALFIGVANALPAVFVTTTKGVSNTLYSVNNTGGVSPLLTAPVASTAINSGISGSSSGYVANALLGGPVKSAAVNWGVSAAALALSATKFASGPLGGIAILAGTALYNYYDGAGLKPVAGGGLGSVPPLTTPPETTFLFNGVRSSGPSSCSAWDATQPANAPYIPTTYQSGVCYHGACGGACFGLSGLQSGCPLNYTLSGSTCNYNGAPSVTPVSDVTAQAALTANPPSNKALVLAQLHNLTNDQYYQNGVLVDPVADAPTLTAPASTTDSTRTTVNSDNSVSQATDTTSCTQTTASSITCAVTTVTVNTPASGTAVTTTTVNSPPDTPATIKADTPKTDCELFPTHIGCSDYGTPAAAEVIPTTAQAATLTPTSLGSGTCPAPISMALTRGTYSLSFQPLCDLATGTAPFFIVMCWLMAGYIVFGSVRD